MTLFHVLLFIEIKLTMIAQSLTIITTHIVADLTLYVRNATFYKHQIQNVKLKTLVTLQIVWTL